MLNARQTRARLKKLAPRKFVSVRKEYFAYTDGRVREECVVWIGTELGILVTGKTFEKCLEKVEAELEAFHA